MRYFQLISEEDFQKEIDKLCKPAFLAQYPIAFCPYNVWEVDVPGQNQLYSTRDWSAQINKDLSKVQWDDENVYLTASDASDDQEKAFYGINTLPNGMTFLGVCAGGDWEIPMVHIIYWDGKQLRGYIPKDGNPWNRATKEAYGNDEEKDDLDALKHFGTSVDDICPDYTLIIADITKRIVKK